MTLKNRPGAHVPGRPDSESGGTEVHSITDAAAAHSDEIHQRMVKYAIAMGIRMVCLILIFVVDGWLKLLPIAGAVFLPWVAVVIANGSDKAEIHSDSLLDYAPLAELDAPDTADPAGPYAAGQYAAEPYAAGQYAAGQDPNGQDPNGQDPNDGADGSGTLLQGELIEDENDDDDHGRAAS